MYQCNITCKVFYVAHFQICVKELDVNARFYSYVFIFVWGWYFFVALTRLFSMSPTINFSVHVFNSCMECCLACAALVPASPGK